MNATKKFNSQRIASLLWTPTN